MNAKDFCMDRQGADTLGCGRTGHEVVHNIHQPHLRARAPIGHLLQYPEEGLPGDTVLACHIHADDPCSPGQHADPSSDAHPSRRLILLTSAAAGGRMPAATLTCGLSNQSNHGPW